MVSHVDDDHIHGILELTRSCVSQMTTDSRCSCRCQLLAQQLRQYHRAQHQGADSLCHGCVRRGFGERRAAFSDERLPRSNSNTTIATPVWSGRSGGDRLQQPESPREHPARSAAARGCEDAESFRSTRISTTSSSLHRGGGSRSTWDRADVQLRRAHARAKSTRCARSTRRGWRSSRKQGRQPSEVLSAYVDKSVPNLSSIVLLAEAEARSILLTGDARGDKILEGLELVGLMEEGGKTESRHFESPASWQRQQSRQRFLRTHRRPSTTCSRVTASTAIRNASRWRCCSVRAATKTTRFT